MKSNLLKSERVKLGITQKNISKSMNIDVTSYCKKENGVTEFKTSEINLIRSILNLTPEKTFEIFFDDEVALKATC